MASASGIDKFRLAVYETERSTEMEARAFLPLATELLLAAAPIEIIQLQDEERSFFGSSDFIICAKVHGDTGREDLAVSIWEIKSPQCMLMEPDDNKSRYRPTKDLYKAENQLIHYWYEAQGSKVFKERFKITRDAQVKMGGIVIGRNDTITRDRSAPTVEAARYSLDIRINTLYRPQGIRLFVWDRIVAFVTPPS